MTSISRHFQLSPWANSANPELFTSGAPVTAEFLAELAAVDVSDAVLATATVGQSITPGLIDILYLGVKLGFITIFRSASVVRSRIMGG